MRIGDILYFSPKYAFSDLDFNDTDAIARAFQDRVDGFYFQPAERLVEAGHAFAAGLVICAGVEFLSKSCSEHEPSDWLAENLKIDASSTEKFWQSFRDGLSHEGRVKSRHENGNQKGFVAEFSFDYPEVLKDFEGVLVVNPTLLLKEVRKAFDNLCDGMSANRKQLLTTLLRRHFRPEVAAAKR